MKLKVYVSKAALGPRGTVPNLSYITLYSKEQLPTIFGRDWATKVVAAQLIVDW